jgi:hypothetical protein
MFLELYLVDRAAKRRGVTLPPEELARGSRLFSLFMKGPDESSNLADEPVKQQDATAGQN